jgi:uncharacterized membrane protein
MRRQLIAALLLAGMFVAGAFAGYWFANRPRPPQLRSMTPGSTVLADALGLSEPQRRAVDSILVAGQPRIDSISQTVQAQLRTAIDSMEGEIRRLLDPEQLRRLDSLRAVGGLPLATGVRLRQPPPR